MKRIIEWKENNKKKKLVFDTNNILSYYQLKEMAYKKDLDALLLQRERQAEKYNECLAKKYQTNEKITTKLAALDNYIKTNYPYTSIEYYDLNSTLNYNYNE